MSRSILLLLTMAKSTILVGGQAVMEGVMMRVPGGYATAVRRKDKSITVERHDYSPLNSRYEWLKFPIIRGVIGLYESMKIGMGTLQWSADILMQDEEENPEEYKESKLGKFLTTLFALTLGIGL
ncbi:MAG: DUF1385 domain-containing protein, partial [Candidatus Marinimicrobia bacterium]|nr:DUF1385 domain-containing protein [Candidatus Neomarinimicrobiota bacterium]